MAERRRCGLSRGWKILRNLAVLALALTLCWALSQAPVWLTQRALEKEAAEQGAGEVEILWRGNLPARIQGGGGAPLSGQKTMPTVLARGQGQIWSCYMGSYEGKVGLGHPSCWSMPEEPVLLCPLLNGSASVPTQAGVSAVLAAVNLPEGTAEGILEIRTGDGQVRRAESRRDMEVVLFSVPGQENWGWERDEAFSSAPYTLTLLDGK